MGPHDNIKERTPAHETAIEHLENDPGSVLTIAKIYADNVEVPQGDIAELKKAFVLARANVEAKIDEAIRKLDAQLDEKKENSEED